MFVNSLDKWSGPLTISTLPPEILEYVGTFLGGTDIGSLRSTCKVIERHIFKHFKKTYLTELHTDLSLRSINNLQKLSEDNELANNVTKLHIEASSATFYNGFPLGPPWNSAIIGASRHRGLNPGLDMLEDTLCMRLRNCVSFHLTSRCTPGDHPLPHGDIWHSTYALPIVLDVIAHMGRIVFTVSIDYGTCPFSMSRTCSRSRLLPGIWNEQQFHQDGLDLHWHFLETLTLRGTLLNDTVLMNHYLLAAANRLKKLILEFPVRDRFNGVAINFMTWVLPTGPSLHAEHLTIVYGSPTPAALLYFLTRFSRSIRRLDLIDITIRGGLWKEVFERLAQRIPKLETLYISQLKGGPNVGDTWNKVHYSALARDPVVPNSGGSRWVVTESFVGTIFKPVAQYSGPYMNLALKHLVKKIVPPDPV